MNFCSTVSVLELKHLYLLHRVEIYIIRERNVKNITFQSRFVFNVFLQLLISNWLKLISWGF